MRRTALIVLATVASASLVVFFLGQFDLFRLHSNISLVMVMVILFSERVVLSYQWAIGVGLVADTFSAYPFGVLTLSMVAATVCGHFFFRHVFTNRSWPSLVGMTAVASCTYLLVFNGFTGLLYLTGRSPYPLAVTTVLFTFLVHVFLNSLLALLTLQVLRAMVRLIGSRVFIRERHTTA